MRNWGAAPAAATPPLPGLPGGGLLDRPEHSDDLIDELLAGATSSEEIAGPDGPLGELTRRLLDVRWRPVRIRSRDRQTGWVAGSTRGDRALHAPA